MAQFAVVFPAYSYPITSNHFVQVDHTHWVLDICSLVRQQYWEVKEAALFLTVPNSLDPGLALGLYVKCGASDWLYRGCVHNGHPSEVMPLQWPAQEGGFVVPPAPGYIQLGISVEPLAELSAKEGSRLGDKMQFARRVGLDLYRFLEGFATQASGDAILIPTSALDRWLQRFERLFRLDPDFLTRQDEKF